MAVKNNDNKVLVLKKQIAEKKALLEATKRFTPITNCLLEMDGKRVNINVLQKTELVNTLVRVNLYRLSAIDLGIQDTFELSGFLVSEWISDLTTKLAIINAKEEKVKLLQLEEKLSALLSAEKKVELELVDLEDTINNL